MDNLPAYAFFEIRYSVRCAIMHCLVKSFAVCHVRNALILWLVVYSCRIFLLLPLFSPFKLKLQTDLIIYDLQQVLILKTVYYHTKNRYQRSFLYNAFTDHVFLHLFCRQVLFKEVNDAFKKVFLIINVIYAV